MSASVAILQVLGSGTCVPSATRFASSYLLKHPAFPGPWLIDAGPGALQRLAQAGESYREIDSLFLSHTHPDHIASLIPLLHALNYTPGFKRTAPLTVYGPAAVKQYLDLHLGFTPYLCPTFPFQLMALTDGEEVRRGPMRITCRLLQHSTPTLGFRFAWEGFSLVYGADTAPGDGILELSRGADLLILEASFPVDHPTSSHLTTRQAGEIARAAHAGRLLLTHLHAEVGDMPAPEREAEVRQSGFAGEVLFAEDLTCLDLPA